LPVASRTKELPLTRAVSANGRPTHRGSPESASLAGTAAAPVGSEGIARALTRAIEFDGALATLAATPDPRAG
jgi:hypothetical protein